MANPHPTPRAKKFPFLTCVNCGKTKRATSFPKRGGPSYEKIMPTDPKRYDTQCKLCKKPKPAMAKSGYIHKEPVNAKGRGRKRKIRNDWSGLTPAESKQRTRTETRIKSMHYLSKKGCHNCGERDPRKLEYDHKDPATKLRGISRFITDGYSWASPILRAEIRKCRILCANCHRVHTIKQQGYYSHDDVQRTLGEIAGTFGFDI
jgi:hypothetical protein